MQRRTLPRRLGNLPFYPWVIGIYPVIQLLAHNIIEVELSVAIRPILVSLIGATLAYALFLWLTRDSYQAAAITSLLIILFMTYGHLYNLLKADMVLGFALGRHRYLIPGYAIACAIGMWLLVLRHPDLSAVTPGLNALSMILLAMPLFQLVDHFARVSATKRATDTIAQASGMLGTDQLDDAPDIYYIILDGYSRSDYLQQAMGYDNSPFIEKLEDQGFVVAECSRSNYPETLGSLTSALNMEYIRNLHSRLGKLGLDADTVFVLLKQSLVRSQLEDMGYRIVAFQTGFDWTDMRDADIYLSLAQGPFDLESVSPFELLLLQTSAARIALDANYLFATGGARSSTFRYKAHVELQRFILDELPTIASIPEPTFTFAHVLIPHTPYVFGPDGELLTDPGFTGGEKSGPINDDYKRRGYSSAVAFVSSRILQDLTEIIEKSPSPPIIIVQGDHGIGKEDRFLIFNAYYLPGVDPSRIYASITPVNSFRLVFDAYFGTNYGLLPDNSYWSAGSPTIVPETSEACVQGSP